MKTLLLMRHAKSSWKTSGMSDHDRPLNDRGNKATPVIGAFIKDQKLIPDYILCSSALRAQTTAQLVSKHCDFKDKVLTNEKLYLTEHAEYIDQIKKVKPDASTLLVVAHNPTMENLLAHLTGEYKMFKTATLAQIQINIDRWDKLTQTTKGKFIDIWYVRDIEENINA